jgi:hypothetical protein
MSNYGCGMTGSRRTPSGVDISVIVGLASVVVALVFSALQLSSSSEQLTQAREALTLQREAEQLETLLAVSSKLDASRSRMDAILVEQDKLPDNVLALRLVAALRPNESIAYALNHRLVKIPGAARLWGNTLVCNWRFAQQGVYGARVPRYFPELARYVRTAPAAVRNSSCL